MTKCETCESKLNENVSLNKQIEELHKAINTYRNRCFQPGDIYYYKLTMCGMNCRQVLELKEFWMRHHEELPKWANAKSAKQEGE